MKSRMMMAALAAVVLVFGAVQSSMASIRTISVGDTINVRTGLNYRGGSGGEFQLGRVSPDANPTYFHTFCAELGENLGSDTQNYYVKSLGFTAMNAGGTLTRAAANLFSDYYNAMMGKNYGYQGVVGTNYTGPGNASQNFTLAGGTYTYRLNTAATRSTSGRNVQNVLWRMLGYTTGPALNATETSLMNWYNANHDGTFRNVRLANLVNANNHNQRFQDQFVVITPEPGSLLVWGVLGLAGVGMTNRRRKS
jgi:hypothetical protein